LFTAVYPTGGLFREESLSIFRWNRSTGSASWADHKKVMQIILYALLVRAIDPWDLSGLHPRRADLKG